LTCEFKTKSDNIKNFINVPHGGNVVVSFSINPQKIVSEEEHRTASLSARLNAARISADRGFPVAFHIDPMIYFEGWQEHYSDLAQQVATMFRPDEVKWISVGGLRYPPDMKNMLRERFPSGTQVLTGEMFLGDDGKLRYDQDLRNEMFEFVKNEFIKASESYPVFLCMETPASWNATFQATPRKVEKISNLFAPVVSTIQR
jgi:spore photoproduct lyase